MCLDTYTRNIRHNIEGYKVFMKQNGKILSPVYREIGSFKDRNTIKRPFLERRFRRFPYNGRPHEHAPTSEYHKGRFCFFENLEDARDFLRAYGNVIYHVRAGITEYEGKLWHCDKGLTFLAPRLEILDEVTLE